MMMSPHSLVILLLAAFTGLLATVLFIVAVATDSWDHLTFNYVNINSTVNHSGRYQSVQPIWSATGNWQQVGIKLVNINATSTGYCIVDLSGGVWRTCNKAKDPKNELATACSKLDAMWPTRNCFNYISDYRDRRERPGGFESAEHIIKMQNNTIACCIVVLLCVVASTLTALIGVIMRVVPSVMVTGVLYLMGGVFIIFANSILHEKMRRTGVVKLYTGAGTCDSCECYSVLGVPKELCLERYMSMQLGWSLILSWVSSFGFFLACALWLYFTRLLRIESAKNML